MNGRYFDWNKVVKNRQTGTFEEVKPQSPVMVEAN
jgi:hypothetical protein